MSVILNNLPQPPQERYYWQRELEIIELTANYEETSFASALIAGLGAGWVVMMGVVVWVMG